MTQYRISQAAGLLGVSVDTVRRWVETGKVATVADVSGPTMVDGASLAQFARDHADAAEDPSGIGRSARNRLVGLVTAISSDTVMSQVEIQAGPHRVVSL